MTPCLEPGTPDKRMKRFGTIPLDCGVQRSMTEPSTEIQINSIAFNESERDFGECFFKRNHQCSSSLIVFVDVGLGKFKQSANKQN
jgi:hypothetical protein